MRKFSLAVAAAIVLSVALFAPSVIARQQASARFEYLRVAPYMQPIETVGVVASRWAGYRACVAASAEWTCRDFQNRGSDALPATLATLGNEGWELVSATIRNDDDLDRGGLTYLFKRQRQ